MVLLEAKFKRVNFGVLIFVLERNKYRIARTRGNYLVYSKHFENTSAGLVSDYIRRQRRREAASLAVGSDDEDEDRDVILPRTMEMERVRRAIRQRRGQDLRRDSESTRWAIPSVLP